MTRAGNVRRAPAPCFAMVPLVGDFLQPLPRLAIYVSQVGEGAQRPEILAQISDAARSTLPFSQAAAT